MDGEHIDIIGCNKLKLSKNRLEFQVIFKVSLTRFMHPLFGFDVIAFDRFIQPNDGESTYQATERKYGSEAVKLVMGII